MQEWDLLIYIFIFNALIALFYLILMFRRIEKIHLLLMTLFLLFCPVIGFGFLSLTWLVYRLHFSKNEDMVNLEELSFNKDKLEMILAPKLSEEENIVPIEEALIIQDKYIKREVLLKLLKSDFEKSLNFIANAVENEDGEVSHYAAAAITEKIAEFKALERKLSEEVKKAEHTQEAYLYYIDYVYHFLKFHILSVPEHAAYSRKLVERIKDLENLFPEAVNGRIIRWVIKNAIELKDYECAEFWLQWGLLKRSEDLDVYKAGLEYYHNRENYIEFSRLLNQLKSTNIILDSQMLELVRYYRTDEVRLSDKGETSSVF